MKRDRTGAKGDTRLRKRAEKQIKESARVPKALPRDDILELIHELEVHQVELELQNEELRRSQSEIEVSRKKYFDLYDLAPIGYVTLDRNGLIREINLTGAELLGREKRYLMGSRFARFVHQSDQDNFHKFCRRLFEAAGREEAELRLSPPQRLPMDVLLSGAAIQDGEGNSNVCKIAITDVTIRKRAENWLRKLIETTQDGVVSIDRSGHIALFNLTAEKMFGYSAAEVMGKKVNLIMAEPYAGEHDGYIARYEQTGEGRAIGKIRTVAARRKNGEIFPIELSVNEVDESNEGRYVAFIRDITEKARLQAQLVEKAQLAVIGETAAKIVHEIANPLNGMFMNIQLVERRVAPAGDEVVTTSIKRIGNEVSRLKNLLYDFRSLSRPETYDLRPTALADIAREVCALESAAYAAKGIRVELAMDPSLPLVLADRAKLKQALLNLCKNAEEAMPEGGTLTLQVRASDGKVILEVGDTGIGVPEDLNLLEPFATTKPLGSGLGLVIVRQIVACHHGELSYVSAPGKGTSFSLALPVESAGANRPGRVIQNSD
jgi:PAS domain S-box-containing protein